MSDAVEGSPTTWKFTQYAFLSMFLLYILQALHSLLWFFIAMVSIFARRNTRQMPSHTACPQHY